MKTNSEHDEGETTMTTSHDITNNVHWTGFAASIPGGGHIRRGIPCQDASAVMIAPRPAAIVCDGRGSASLSHFGAQGAVDAFRFQVSVLEPFLVNILDEEEVKQDQWIKFCRIMYRTLMQVKYELAEKHDQDEKEFDCTVAFVIAGKKHIGCFQVGDGSIVLRQNGVCKTVFLPEKGEFANQTHFLRPGGEEEMKFQHILLDADVNSGIAITSDGPEHLMFHLADMTPGKIFDMLLDDLCKEELCRQDLMDYLTRREWADDPRGADDRSLALLARIGAEPVTEFVPEKTEEEPVAETDAVTVPEKASENPIAAELESVQSEPEIESVAKENPAAEIESVAKEKPAAEIESVAKEKPAAEIESVEKGNPAAEIESVAKENPAAEIESVAKEEKNTIKSNDKKKTTALTESANVQKVDTTNPAPRCPILLVLDTSENMKGDPINELENGLCRFISDIKNDEAASASVELCIVTMDEKATVQVPFASVKNLVPEKLGLKAEGGAFTGKALERVAEVICARRKAYARNGISAYAPCVILLSNSTPEDNWESAAQNLLSMTDKIRMQYIGIAIGEKANIQIMQKMLPPQPGPLKLSQVRFKAFFRWLSDSLSSVSQNSVSKQTVPQIKKWSDVFDRRIQQKTTD